MSDIQRMEEKLSRVLRIKEQAEKGEEVPRIYEEQIDKLLRIEEKSGRCPRIIMLRGRTGSGRKTLMCHAAARLGCRAVFTDIDRLCQCCMEEGIEVLELLACMLHRSKFLFCLTVGREAGREERWDEFLHGLVQQEISCYILTDQRIPLPMEGKYEQVEILVPEPDIAQRERLWRHFLKGCGEKDGLDASVLAGKYTMNAGGIKKVVDSARLYRDARGSAILAEEDIIRAVETSQSERFSDFAVRVPAEYGWEDLAVPEETEGCLRQLCSQVIYRSQVGSQWGFFEKKHYGRGISALFHGPSGTGKTMAAQVIAKELGLPLYQVDLSQMMSKYIGETQKNISSLFDQAKGMDMVLLFDEADAFFTKRTGIKDSHDRHSNSEVAHLLQKMEEYEGVSILTTNLKENLDEAFKRRIKIMVEFQLPDEKARKRIWRMALPERAPVEADVDLEFYARRFELSGSEIQETMLNAAFLAAAAGERIAHRHVKTALRQCYLKYGKVLLDEELEKNQEDAYGNTDDRRGYINV